MNQYPVIVKEAAVSDMCFKEVGTSESVDEESSIVGWGSRPTIDRDKELIEYNAWALDNYRKNPVLLLCHKHDVPPVGKCLWVKADKFGLKFKARFANTERGKEVYELYKTGIMKGFSVGFKPRPNGIIDNPKDLKYKGCKRVFTDVELVEISCVPVPAHADALVEYVKAGKIITKGLKDELELVLEITDDPPAATETKVEDDTIEKIEVTEEMIHVPVAGEEGEHKEHKIRYIDISKKEGIQGKYCVDCKFVISYTFDKEKWDKKRAVKWVADHKKELDTIEITIKEDESIEIKTTMEPDADGDFVFKAEEVTTEETKESVEEFIKRILPDKEFEIKSAEDLCAVIEKSDSIEDLKETVKALEAQVAESPVVQKAADSEGMPSLYDLTSAVDIALNFEGEKVPYEMGYRRKNVVDIFATEYPSGHVVFSQYNPEKKIYGYFQVDYAYDLPTRTVSITGDPEEVLQSWISERYMTENKDEEDLELKSGRMISAKNRALLSDCSGKMKAAMEAIMNLIGADDKEGEEDKDLLEIIEKADDEDEDECPVDGMEYGGYDETVSECKSCKLRKKCAAAAEEKGLIEIEETQDDDDVVEIDEAIIKEAVASSLDKRSIKLDTKSIAKEVIAKLQGRATL